MIRAYWTLRKRPNASNVVGWTPTAFIYSRIGREQIVDAAQRNSQIPKGYLDQTFDALVVEIENFVMNGHSITLDRFGTIRSYLRTDGVVAESDFDAATNINQVKFNFKVSSRLLRALKQVKVEVTDRVKPYPKSETE